MKIEETEFRKHIILVVKKDNDKRIFSAGIKKVNDILENIEVFSDALREFSRKHTPAVQE